MKKLLYILLFIPIALFGQEDLLLNYMNCIEGYEQEVSSIQSQIIEKNNSLALTETQFLGVLAYCNLYSVEEQVYDYCYSEVESSFSVILANLEYEIDFLLNELVTIQYLLHSNNPCGDYPDDICALIYCIDTHDNSTINEDFDCINPEHILGSTFYCCSYYFCGMPGCKDINACNYDNNAEVDDGSCIYSIGDCVENTIDKWCLSRDLESGWNMIGYGCPSPIDVAEVLSNHTESINLVKDNNGSVYIPEFGFNGMGDFIPGLGYQIKVAEVIEDFSLCDWYSSDSVVGSVANIENENIILNSNNSNLLDSLVITQSINTDLQQDIELITLQNNILLYLVQSSNQVIEENVLSQDSLIIIHNANIVSLQEENASLQAELDSIYGCIDESACDYDVSALLDDGSCVYPELGYDCNGNTIYSCLEVVCCGQCDILGLCTQDFDILSGCYAYNCAGSYIDCYIVGMHAEGGIVFYVDSTGQHGLVAAMEDLTEGATDPYEYGFNGYEWGCYQQNIDGAYGTSLGTGYLNTIDIVNQGCETEIGGVTASQAALDAEVNGYSDWYLPSKDELYEMYNTIGNGSPEGNIGGFESSLSPFYWSSSEYNSNDSWGVDFNSGISYSSHKTGNDRVRVIRAF